MSHLGVDMNVNCWLWNERWFERELFAALVPVYGMQL